MSPVWYPVVVMTLDQKRLLSIKELAVTMLARAQDIRIQQVQACNESRWPKHLTDKSNAAWKALNDASESIEAELGKLIAEAR